MNFNFENYKNMIGSFFPAKNLYYWPEFVQYLPENQYKSGLAEAFKTALLFELTTLGISILSDSNNYSENLRLFGENIGIAFQIKDDILGLVRSINGNFSISKVLFYGAPGIGKTESAGQIARLLNRDLLSVNMEDLIDSHLGQTSKNIVSLFDEINIMGNDKNKGLLNVISSI